MRKWSKAPRILSLLAVMIAAAVGFAPAAHAAEGDVMIGDSAYASVPEAVKAIVDKKEPQGSTIKLTKDLTGPGVQVAGGQEFTFDLGGHTYTVTDPTVGSTGTETNAFQLIMGSNLTFRTVSSPPKARAERFLFRTTAISSWKASRSRAVRTPRTRCPITMAT